MRPFTRLPRADGFTLVELLISVAMVSILSVIAVSLYSAQVQKSRRGDAKAALLDLAAREERYYSTNNQYTASATALGYGGTFPYNISNYGVTSYTLSVTTTLTGTTATGFTATATAVNKQASDACGNYAINDAGTQSNTGSQTSPPCW